MRVRRWLIIAGAGLLTVALAALARPVVRWFETPASLASALREMHAGRYDAAEATLRRFLDRSPGHREANILMAQVLIDRPKPKPEEALGRLKRVRARDPKVQAVVRVQEGKALYLTHRLAESEAAWTEALRLNPKVSEAGWLLIQQYYLQGREDDARRLALRLSQVEPDPHDRVRYLLELVREDVERLSAAGVIQWLEPAVRLNPEDRASVLAYGRALVKEGRTEEGLNLLRKAVADRPDDFEGWDALLGGLADAGEVDPLAKELARVPPAVAADRRLAAYRGRVAQEQRDYPAAIRAYAEALEARPFDVKLLYRMARTLRLAGRNDEAKRHEQVEASVAATQKEMKGVYQETQTIKTLGEVPEPRLYQRIAELRERVGKADEALAWHRLVLRDDPQNLVSRQAVARLAPRDAPAG